MPSWVKPVKEGEIGELVPRFQDQEGNLRLASSELALQSPVSLQHPVCLSSCIPAAGSSVVIGPFPACSCPLTPSHGETAAAFPFLNQATCTSHSPATCSVPQGGRQGMKCTHTHTHTHFYNAHIYGILFLPSPPTMAPAGQPPPPEPAPFSTPSTYIPNIWDYVFPWGSPQDGDGGQFNKHMSPSPPPIGQWVEDWGRG